MRLQELMNTRVVTVSPDATADEAWLQMRRRRIRHLVVGDDSGMVGVVSERDLGGPNGRTVRHGRSVRELMVAAPASGTPTMTLRQAANLMRGRRIGSLPVVDAGRVVGIVTATDVLDELGRGSTRPEVRAQRQSMRTPPASARRAAAARAGRRTARRATAATAVKTAPAGGGEPPPAAVTGRNTPALGRRRVRRPDSAARAPLAAVAPRAKARAGTPTLPDEIPAFIRATGPRIDQDDRAYLRRKLGRRLGRFALDVQRVSVRLEDLNGPRGGVDCRCRIKVTLRARPSVIVEAQEASAQAAMDRALGKLGMAVRRALQQRDGAVRRARRSVRDSG